MIILGIVILTIESPSKSFIHPIPYLCTNLDVLIKVHTLYSPLVWAGHRPHMTYLQTPQFKSYVKDSYCSPDRDLISDCVWLSLPIPRENSIMELLISTGRAQSFMRHVSYTAHILTWHGLKDVNITFVVHLTCLSVTLVLLYVTGMYCTVLCRVAAVNVTVVTKLVLNHDRGLVQQRGQKTEHRAKLAIHPTYP